MSWNCGRDYTGCERSGNYPCQWIPRELPAEFNAPAGPFALFFDFVGAIPDGDVKSRALVPGEYSEAGDNLYMKAYVTNLLTTGYQVTFAIATTGSGDLPPTVTVEVPPGIGSTSEPQYYTYTVTALDISNPPAGGLAFTLTAIPPIAKQNTPTPVPIKKTIKARRVIAI